MLSVGGLFEGAGLLACGLHQAGLRHEWMCESEPWRRDLLAKRFPGIPVYPDVRGVRAADAVRVDVIAGGFPCKGASTAGKRNGFEHAETVLWHEMRRVVGELQPCYVLIENVADILKVARFPGEPAGSLWSEVLADLAALGFDVEWDCFPAAAFGAPHVRDRLIAVACHADRMAGASDLALGGAGGAVERSGAVQRTERSDGDARAAADADAERQQGLRREGTPFAFAGDIRGEAAADADVEWGVYQAAITRWETIHGPAPAPLIRAQTQRRLRRLDARDADVPEVRPGMDRSELRAQRQRLSALGDGVHVYLGRLAGEHIVSLERERLARELG